MLFFDNTANKILFNLTELIWQKERKIHNGYSRSIQGTGATIRATKRIILLSSILA